MGDSPREELKRDGASVATPGSPRQKGHMVAWLGLAKQKSGDIAGARAAWEQALVIEPDYAWIKYGLMRSK